ncbi:cupin domain-containing protein [Desulfopila sp. IMCC35008]|uniref:cupin domain-containing protein n=1 Tax=Desulfopila sp. IMCC35008 TaxID=2653858 RepID=UPI0013D10CE6|nr:cupin domain-containing protein [Desulfopila sp. IMCC35008]
MKYQSINFEDKLGKFSEHWSPRVIAEMNDYQFKLVKIEGDFTWHDHKGTDEVFMVLSGSMEIEFRDGSVQLTEGEMFVVKKGLEHKPYAKQECEILIIEPRGVVNTGESESALKAENDIWI